MVVLTVRIASFLISIAVLWSSFEITSIVAAEAALAPVSALGELTEGEKQIIFNRLERKLSETYALVSHEQYEAAQTQAYEILEVKECTEEQCIREIQEVLQIERLFILQIIRESDTTQLALSLRTLDDKKVVEELCQQCTLTLLYEKIENLAERLIQLDRASMKAAEGETEEQKAKQEEELWNQVKESSNVVEIQEFLLRYPEGPFSSLAQYRHKQLEHQTWKAINHSKDLAAFRRFVANFPNSAFASEAQRQLEVLEIQEREASFFQKNQIRNVSLGISALSVYGYVYSEQLEKDRAGGTTQKAISQQKSFFLLTALVSGVIGGYLWAKPEDTPPSEGPSTAVELSQETQSPSNVSQVMISFRMNF